MEDLSELCRVQMIGPCASVSLVGRNIRGILHQLGGALALFAEQRIYMVSQAANDLNFTFVVDESQGDRLVQELHDLLIRPVRGDTILGPTWEQIFGVKTAERAGPPPWWRERRAELLQVAAEHEAVYVYDRASVRAAARMVRAVQGIDRVFYAMKANPHAELLRVLEGEGIGFECVSQGEVERVLDTFPRVDRDRVLYTPNFASRAEYAWAVEAGVHVTLDSLYMLRNWPELFAGREIFVRFDTGTGRGHHQHVKTAGAQSKFGVPLVEATELGELAARHRVRIVGLHAHPGSGIFDVTSWAETARQLLNLAQQLPDVRCIDLGGGLGVPDSTEQAGVDLAQLGTALLAVRQRRPEIEVWLEPGRYLVATAGVLLAKVTQTKAKADNRFIGVATGMNSLIRPALYGAWHDIVNLTRLDDAASEIVDVVGPICESADFLGRDRLMPPTQEGDVLLIANTGAYGRAMSSHYNLRAPALEIVI
jgi:diaminopimelate decarboxylase/aspartate kinase